MICFNARIVLRLEEIYKQETVVGCQIKQTLMESRRNGMENRTIPPSAYETGRANSRKRIPPSMEELNPFEAALIRAGLRDEHRLWKLRQTREKGLFQTTF